MNKIMYIVVNKDLNMSPGKIGAHTAHAVFDYLYKETTEAMNNSLMDAQRELIENTYEMDDFKEYGDTICILKASEKDMLKFENQGYIAVRDMGRTEVRPNSLTAINLGIYDKDKEIPKFIQRLRLLTDNDVLVVYDMMCEEVFGVYTNREEMLKAFIKFSAENNYEISNSQSETMISLIQRDKDGKVIHTRSFDISSHTLNK